jgi:FtsH-binding integral membrane protein
LRRSLANTIYVSSGILLAPTLCFVNAIFPGVLYTSLILTGTTTAGMVSYALLKPSGSLISWGPSLLAGLWGMVGLSVAQYFGYHSFDFAGSIFGIGLFAALTAFDIQLAVHQYGFVGNHYSQITALKGGFQML